jgi:hypothetical protein
VRLDRASDAIDGGSLIPIATTATVVCDLDDLDPAMKLVLQNQSDTAITVSLKANPALGEGIVLLPGTGGIGGGTWDEDRWAGIVYARHHGASGNKNLMRMIF